MLIYLKINFCYGKVFQYIYFITYYGKRDNVEKING